MKLNEFHIIALSSKLENFRQHLHWLAKHYLQAVHEELQYSWLKENRLIQLDKVAEVISFFEQCCQDSQHYHILLGQLEQKNVAYFFGLIKNNIAEIPQQTGYINGLYVIPEMRHHGLGSLMLNEANKWFRASAIKTIELNVTHRNTSAEQFWEKHGYKPCETIYATLI